MSKPSSRKTRIDNRGYHYGSKIKDRSPDFNVSLEDIDSAILYYFENVIRPSVKENDENIKVPILYGSAERWKSILKDGYLKDKKRQTITPVIVFKRNTINLDETIPQDKLDANNPFQQRFTQTNKYDNLTAQIQTTPQREYHNVTFPDYVVLNYSFVVWTSYIQQMNKIVEKITYSDGAYWGRPDKMRFRSNVISFDDATEINDTERIVRTNFEVEMRGYILTDQFNSRPTKSKYISPKKLIFVNEELKIDV